MEFVENQYIELKEKYIDDIKKEIIAFANSDGGTLYIGVKDDGTVIGLEDIDSTSLQVINSCRDAIKPDITMFIKSSILTIDNKRVLSIQVQRGTSRPYYLSNKGLKPSGVYIRQGSSCAPASDQSIRQMIKETDGDKFEDMRSLNQDLSFNELTNEFSKRSMDIGPVQMKTLGLINQDNIYTNLALLLSDQCPHILKAATFSGNDQEVFQDRKEFSGSLLKQLNDTYSYMELRNQTKATFEGLLRIDSKDFPEEALRESLLNAIIHRDYSYSASTLVSIYSNRMELVSFGGIPGGVTLADVMLGLSVCRNQKLANIFYRLNLIEAYGTGLKKIRDSYKHTDLLPEILSTANAFKVILPNINSTSTKNHEKTITNSQAIISFINEHGSITREQVEEILDINTTAAVRLLRKLKEYKSIISVGKGKNTKYILNK